jgi:hypothetical protein
MHVSDGKGAKKAIWRTPGKPDRIVGVLDQLPTKPGRAPMRTVYVMETNYIEAALVSELTDAKTGEPIR